MYARKRQIPRHRGEQILGGRALVGAATGGLKNLAGQLFDGKKGVDFGQVGKAALGGAAGSIPIVGGAIQNAITGGGAQGGGAQQQTQNAQAPTAGAPGATGVPGLMGQLGQGGGQGLMGLAKGFMGMGHGGGIPYNPELAGAPYRMRGVRLMKSGGINEYGAGGNVYAENGVKTPDGDPPRYFQSQMSAGQIADLENEFGDNLYKDRPDLELQRKVELGLASKADRDDKSFTKDFNPVPLNDLYEGMAEVNRNIQANTDIGKMVNRGDDILKIRGEYVPYDADNYSTTSEDYAKRNEMLRSRYAGEDSDYVNPQDVWMEQEAAPKRRKGGLSGGIYDKTGMGDTGFTLEEIGSGQDVGDQYVGDLARSRGRRSLDHLMGKLRAENRRVADVYEGRAYGDIALPGKKQFAGGRVRPIKRRR